MDSLYSLVGPQSDGTNIPALTGTNLQPTDAGGGAPADYSQSVIDLFKTGIGAWTATQQNQQMLDYKRYEATAAGLAQQGRPISATVGGTTASISTGSLLTLAIIGIAVLVAVKALD
jgi:hypothetical protein